MNQPVGILSHKEDMKLNFTGEFDGLQTVEMLYDLMSPAGKVDHVALDFSRASRVRPLEIYYLLSELSIDPHLRALEISVEGLQCRHMRNGP